MPYAPSAHTETEVRHRVREHLIPAGGATVAERDRELVGLVAVSHDGERGWIDQMYVAPSRVNQGIGSALLAHVLRTASAPVRLYTFQENVGARRFYERHGFLAIQFTDGRANEEHCPDVLYESGAAPKIVG
jgi:GNAT superfamily N-acetyltransferase